MSQSIPMSQTVITSIPFIGDENKYHYLYKIINVKTGEFYTGKRSNKKYTDGYSGSGLRIKAQIKKYGTSKYIKYITRFFCTEQDVYNYEENKVTTNTIKNKLCLNLDVGGRGCMTGRKHSDETKKKMSKSQKGKVMSEESRLKMSLAWVGRVVSEETKLKMSKSTMGNKHSDETKKKMSESQKGKVISDETRRKISESQKGKVISEETRLKISKSNMGRVHSDETKQKMSDNHCSFMKGKTHSEETKKKMRESAKTRPPQSDETKKKRSESMKGVPKSAEHIRKIIEWQTGYKQKIVTCPHCNKSGGKNNMTRYHFDNCKLNKKEV